MKKYTRKRNKLKTEFEFLPSDALPKEIPISAPLTFAFMGQDLVLTKKKNGWWDILGGKVRNGESWQDALKREAYEEAGVTIDDINVIGYVKAVNSGEIKDLKFPITNILPITISFIKKVDKNWQRHETVAREAFNRKRALKVFDERGDNGQLKEILEYVNKYFDGQNYKYVYEFIEDDKELEDVPNTQSMVFLRTDGDNFVIVKDKDEKHYSLPGGGCRIDESGRNCVIRETKEEAQVDMVNLKLFGNIIVSVCKDDVVLSRTTHQRYVAKVRDLNDFIPEKDGFETIERKIVGIDELQDYVKLLKNDTGTKTLEVLKKYI